MPDPDIHSSPLDEEWCDTLRGRRHDSGVLKGEKKKEEKEARNIFF
jgi:hypothetical protein